VRRDVRGSNLIRLQTGLACKWISPGHSDICNPTSVSVHDLFLAQVDLEANVGSEINDHRIQSKCATDAESGTYLARPRGNAGALLYDADEIENTLPREFLVIPMSEDNFKARRIDHLAEGLNCRAAIVLLENDHAIIG